MIATSIRVGCVTKSHSMDPHARITAIGGVANNHTWKLSQSEAIEGIEAGRWQFHVTRGGNTVKVVVAVSRFGHKYLKTEADGEQPDNLLSLPECP